VSPSVSSWAQAPRLPTLPSQRIGDMSRMSRASDSHGCCWPIAGAQARITDDAYCLFGKVTCHSLIVAARVGL
jgi:hypothetical protein